MFHFSRERACSSHDLFSIDPPTRPVPDPTRSIFGPDPSNPTGLGRVAAKPPKWTCSNSSRENPLTHPAKTRRLIITCPDFNTLIRGIIVGFWYAFLGAVLTVKLTLTLPLYFSIQSDLRLGRSDGERLLFLSGDLRASPTLYWFLSCYCDHVN
jgi:hypothetical protein